MDAVTSVAAMTYLGAVLTILAELHPDDRCRALNDAFEFYNERNPDQKVTPVAGYTTRLVHSGPLDSPC